MISWAPYGILSFYSIIDDFDNIPPFIYAGKNNFSQINELQQSGERVESAYHASRVGWSDRNLFPCNYCHYLWHVGDSQSLCLPSLYVMACQTILAGMKQNFDASY